MGRIFQVRPELIFILPARPFRAITPQLPARPIGKIISYPPARPGPMQTSNTSSNETLLKEGINLIEKIIIEDGSKRVCK